MIALKEFGKPSDVALSVIAPLIVAALVNWNDAVTLIDAVNEPGFHFDVRTIDARIANDRRELARARAHPGDAGEARGSVIVHGVDHLHDVVPVHERGHDHGKRPRSRSRKNVRDRQTSTRTSTRTRTMRNWR